MRGQCNKCGVSSFLSRGKDEPCACGGTVKAKHEQSNEVVRAGDAIKATWSDAARKAAIESRKRHGLEGAKFQDHPDYFKKWARHHESMAEYHENALREGPTNPKEENAHEEALEMHDKAAFHYTKAAQYHGTASKDRADHHLQMAERYSVDAKDDQKSEAIHATGNSEGAKKGWEMRGGVMHIKRPEVAHQADAASEKADKEGTREAHLHAASLHEAASAAHLAKKSEHNVGREKRHFGAEENHAADHHMYAAGRHEYSANFHRAMAGIAKASDTTSTEVIHCRSHSALGPVLAANKPWSQGEQVSFMWMPAGTHTICAGFRKGSIELTVQCSEETAQAVQASLDEWRSERPKQEPFGCIEHKEQEASFRIGASCGFKWGNDGVYLAAEPTTLGAQNVNGRIHRSWSPSFTTDADYASATERDGVLMFPEGARGSRSNPAKITGVDFCVGTLTNKPAFREMSPVKAKDNKDADYNRTNGGNQATNEELAISFRNDVPDYTEAELLVYCNRIRKGGSHMEAVTEARATRNAKSKASEKPTLESIFAKTHKATETANSIAESHGVVKLTAADVYEKFSVKAGGTSDGVKKGWQHRNRFSEKAESNGIKMNLIGGWQDLAAYYHGDDGNAWKYQNGSFANMGDVSDFRKNFSSRHRGQLDEESTKASDATPDSILERIYARAGASR